MISKDLDRKVFWHRFRVFWITFILYAAVHSCSSVWSYSKDNLRNDPTYSFSTHFFGTCDLAFLLAYSLSFYFFGWIGDKIDLRIFLSTGLLGICMSFGALGLMRYFHYHNETLFVLFMTLNGMFQSVVSLFFNYFILFSLGMARLCCNYGKLVWTPAKRTNNGCFLIYCFFFICNFRDFGQEMEIWEM